MAKIEGGRVMAKALKAEGVDTVFTLTGGHIVGVMGGCVAEGMHVIDVRHEQAASHAADAYARLTGKLGVAVLADTEYEDPRFGTPGVGRDLRFGFGVGF